jgi:hypothetical protein
MGFEAYSAVDYHAASADDVEGVFLTFGHGWLGGVVQVSFFGFGSLGAGAVQKLDCEVH